MSGCVGKAALYRAVSGSADVAAVGIESDGLVSAADVVDLSLQIFQLRSDSLYSNPCSCYHLDASSSVKLPSEQCSHSPARFLFPTSITPQVRYHVVELGKARSVEDVHAGVPGL